MRYLPFATWIALLFVVVAPVAADDEFPDADVVLRALVDELTRSMELQLEDLEKPYFGQYSVQESLSYNLSATYGGIVSDSENRNRRLHAHVRVGSRDLDNTNFQRSRGARAVGLPIEDDYTALRKAIWFATDQSYKSAVETLTEKRAYMKDKEFADRPPDFTEAPASQHFDPKPDVEDPREAWREKLRRISKIFEKHEVIQDSNISLGSGSQTSYLVNSEGTRLRLADTGVQLSISAEVQAMDGDIIADGQSYIGEKLADLPSEEKIIADIRGLVDRLTKAMEAPVLDTYIGPVLFDGIASAQVFQTLLAAGIAGTPETVGGGRRGRQGAEDLARRLGKRVLPDFFRVYDDPRVKKVGDIFLAGHYRFDDEGVAARRVDLIEDGILETMLMSRAPTQKLSGTTGHGRGTGRPQASVGCLFIEHDEGMGPEELKRALIDAAKDQGLEYAVRVSALKGSGLGGTQDLLSLFLRFQRGRRTGLSDPLHVYRVYVEDGREEPVRRCEFGEVTSRALRDILAAGNTPVVFNDPGIGLTGRAPTSSIIAPAIIFEELDLSKIEQELDKTPILNAPHTRP